MKKALNNIGILLILFVVLLTVAACSKETPDTKENPVSKEYPVTVEASVVKVLPDDEKGAKHQRFLIHIDKVLENPKSVSIDTNRNVLVALRYGDKNGIPERLRLEHAIGKHMELKGMYVPKDGNQDPVLHFTHHPVGYVKFDNHIYR
jgi:hypothetical protein